MTTSTPRLAIIVPMLNEAAELPGLLSHLRPYQQLNCEIILVDGGSQDDSVAIATAAGFAVLHSPAGRARQLNQGAQASQAEWLLFLHADTRLPAHSAQYMAQALSGKQLAWGRFDVHIEGRSRLLPLIALLMNYRSRWTGIATGDQAMFVTRSALLAVGGFPDQNLMEDIELSRRLKRLAKPQCLSAKVSTSGRRWEQHGVCRTLLLMWRLRLAYWLGVPAEQLAKRYR